MELKPRNSFTMADGFRISRIANINSMNPAFPIDQVNPYFLGPGKGLPGGGPELALSPSLPMTALILSNKPL